MDKRTICEALYALPSGAVVRRKKSVLPSIVVIVAGVAGIVLYYMMRDNLSNNLASSLILSAGGVLLVGLLMLSTALTDKEGRPVLSQTGEPLRYTERYYPIERKAEVRQLIEDGSLKRLLSVADGSVSGIAVAIYHTSDLRIVAAQAYEYVDFEYRPVSSVKVIEKG